MSTFDVETLTQDYMAMQRMLEELEGNRDRLLQPIFDIFESWYKNFPKSGYMPFSINGMSLYAGEVHFDTYDHDYSPYKFPIEWFSSLENFIEKQAEWLAAKKISDAKDREERIRKDELASLSKLKEKYE